MKKYIYVCPRCGRSFVRYYLPRRTMSCPVCDTVWKTRRAKGTRAYFSWKLTIIFWVAVVILALVALRFWAYDTVKPLLSFFPGMAD